MKPRRVKLTRDAWFEANKKQLMQEYIQDRSGLLWMAWLNNQYEAYRG